MKKGFLNQYHERTFEKAIVKLDKNNKMLMSAVYLLTADSKLWKQCKKHIEGNRICFDAFKPVNCTEMGYTVYCAAKDVYLGSTLFTLNDLADKSLISAKMLEMLCIAVAIKRSGISVLYSLS